MTLMYIQEDKTLHVKDTDARICHSVAVTTHRNVNIDFKGKLCTGFVIFPLGFLRLTSRTSGENAKL